MIEISTLLGPEDAAAVARVFDAPTSVFSDLVAIARLDPTRDLRHLNFTGVDFAGSDLRGYDFTGADLTRTSWDGAIHDETTIVRAATLDGARGRRRDARIAASSTGTKPQPRWQTTIGAPFEFGGVGLHSGEPVRVVVSPASPNAGLVFNRPTPHGSYEIPARHDHVTATELSIVLSLRRLRASTESSVASVEHLLAALAGLGVDNAEILVDGPELPALDGSAALFAEAIVQAGIVPLSKPARALAVRKPIRYESGDSWIEFSPGEGLFLDVTIDFEHPAIGRQHFVSAIRPETFRWEIARARTFGFMTDIEKLWRSGLALGASLENTIALSDDRIVNPEGLRFADEFARHKALDLLGGLALLGTPLIGRVRAHRPGHSLLVAALHNFSGDSSVFQSVSSAEPTGEQVAVLPASAF
jgi:UDP-3-O-[3-hydroxymyristoyl] N-acetylglucosamine deacetylase